MQRTVRLFAHELVGFGIRWFQLRQPSETQQEHIQHLLFPRPGPKAHFT